MSTLKRIAKNAGVTFIGTNLLKVLTMVLVILIARYLGDVNYGKFTFAISFTGMFFILLDLGTRILIVRDIAQNKKNASKIVSNVLFLKLLTSAVVYILILGIAKILGYDQQTFLAVAIAALGLVFDSFATTVGSIYQAFERLEVPVATKLLRIILRFGVSLYLLLTGHGFMSILIVYVCVQALNFIISLTICYRMFIKPSFEIDIAMIKSIIVRAFPFFLSGIFVSVYFRIDVTLMSKLVPTSLAGLYLETTRDAVIGWYGSAYNLLDAVTSLPVAVSAATLPVMIVYFKESKKKLEQIYGLTIKFMTYLSIPLAVGTTLVADEVILLLYGPEYGNAALALKILIWTMIPLCINYMMGAAMIAVHQEKKGLVVLFFNAIVNLSLNVFLIPRYSLYGAAAATVMTELFYFLGYYIIMSRSLAPIRFTKILPKPILSALAMASLLSFIPGMSVFLRVPIAVFVYIALMIIMKSFTKDEMDLFIRSVKK